jgi:hypothetical protein
MTFDGIRGELVCARHLLTVIGLRTSASSQAQKG